MRDRRCVQRIHLQRRKQRAVADELRICRVCESAFHPESGKMKGECRVIVCSKVCKKRLTELRNGVPDQNQRLVYRYGTRGPKIKPVVFVCIHCKSIFNPPNPKSSMAYCSLDCKRNSKEEVRNCAECGGEYKVKAKWVDKKCCSSECARSMLTKCNKERLVGHVYKNVHKCEECGKEFRRVKRPKNDARYCSKRCYGVVKSRILFERFKETYPLPLPSWISGSVRRRARQMAQKNGAVNRNRVIKRDHGVCYLCGSMTDKRHGKTHNLYPNADHVIPLSRGGSHGEENMRCACRRCNTAKADMTVIEFIGSGRMVYPG